MTDAPIAAVSEPVAAPALGLTIPLCTGAIMDISTRDLVSGKASTGPNVSTEFASAGNTEPRYHPILCGISAGNGYRATDAE